MATLQADLSLTQTVNNSTPYYYAPVTFQTTVTNTNTVFWSDGISATVPEPPGLVSPVATPSGSTSYDPGTGTWTIGSLAPGASATLAISGDAGNVLDGTQTVTATVTATTPDPNPANNTASAAEASQPAPIAAPITLAPGSGNAVDTCANPPVTFTWDGSAVNAVNPAAPPPNPASLSYAWSCQGLESNCPTPANGGGNTTYVSFISNTLQVDIYVLVFTVTPNGTDPNYQDQPVNQGRNMFAFTTVCLE